MLDVNYVLLWLVGISAVSTLVRSFSRPSEVAPGWRVLAVAALAIGSTGVAFFYTWSGFVVAAFWGMFVFLPRGCVRLLDSFLARGRYAYAKELTQFLAWLYTDPTWRELGVVVRGLELEQAGKLEQAEKLFEAVRAPRSRLGRSAYVRRFLQRGDREGLRRWLEETFGDALFVEAELLPYYIRSLGELGELEHMLLAFEAGLPALSESKDRRSMYLAYLCLFAFCGQVDAVRALCGGPLRDLGEDFRDLWVGTAQFAANDPFDANEVFLRLSREANPSIAAVAEQRRRTRVAPFHGRVSREGIARFEELVRQFSLLVQSPHASAAFQARPIGVYLCMGLTCAGYILQEALSLQYGDRFPFELGGLVPVLVTEYGEWWRVFTCLFLHGGLMHLGMNMLGLFVLGPFVEHIFGSVRFVLAYLAFGIGSSLFVIALTELDLLQNAYLIGASGAVLGLIGATAAILLRVSMAGGTAAGEQLRSVLVILAIQAAFDLSTPQVSFHAHLGGVIAGFVLTWLAQAAHRSFSPLSSRS